MADNQELIDLTRLQSLIWEKVHCDELPSEAVLEAVRCILEGNPEAAKQIQILEHTRAKCWEPAEGDAIRVFLDIDPISPCAGFEPILWNVQSGTALVRREGQTLFVNDKEVKLYYPTQVVAFDQIQEGFRDARPLHPNILDALLDNPHLVPTRMRRDREGRVLSVLFWGVFFSNGNAEEGRHVRYMAYGEDGYLDALMSCSRLRPGEAIAYTE